MTREEAVQIIENMPISHECREFFNLALDALRQPEIIRCKNCKWRQQNGCCYDKGPNGEILYGYWVEDDWYCGDGKHKD